MTHFDDRIRADLNADDEAFLKELNEEPGLFARMSDGFKGRMGGWNAFAWAIAVATSLLGVYAVWRLFGAETTRGQILWAAGAWAAWTAQIAVKQWIFDRMNTLSLLRELKKIELRVARLET